MSDAAKATVFSTSYEPFGRPWGTSGSLASSERYTFLGERNDTVTGQTYLRARQYDPSTGRFTSLDPVLGALGMPQTLNRYPYVVNNPARYTDPTGEIAPIILAALIAIGFFAVGTAVTVLAPDIARTYIDPIMLGVGFLPVVGDLASDPYFAARS